MEQIHREDENQIQDLDYQASDEINFTNELAQQKLLEIGIQKDIQLLNNEQLKVLKECLEKDLSINLEAHYGSDGKKKEEYLCINVDLSQTNLKQKFYQIKGQIKRNQQQIQVQVSRRFSEFDFLNKFLLVNFPHKILPFLQKKFLDKIFSTRDHNDRTEKLQHYLEVLLNDNELKNFEIFQVFLDLDKKNSQYLPETSYKQVFQDHKKFIQKIKNPEEKYFNLPTNSKFNVNQSFEEEFQELNNLNDQFKSIFQSIEKLDEIQNKEFYTQIHKVLLLDQNFEKEQNFLWIDENIKKIQTSQKIKQIKKDFKFVNFRIKDCQESIKRKRLLEDFNNLCKEKQTDSNLTDDQRVNWKLLSIKSQEKFDLIKNNFEKNLKSEINNIKNIIQKELKENFQTVMYDYFYNNQLISFH